MSAITFQNMKELPYALEEAVNRLMINVNFTDKNIRNIMVTSSLPDEGKSFVAVNLWRKLAESGYRTILVDSDFRNSVMQERYTFMTDAAKLRGISYFLSGQISLDEAIYQTNIPNGDIIPLSETINNPSSLLHGDTYKDMLKTLAQRYDYVIIDTAPLDAVADGERIASLCDGAILVVRAGSTPKALISESIKLLERTGCQILGAVRNRVVTGAGSKYGKYGKYRKYGYGYGYGYGSRHESGGRSGKKREDLKQKRHRAMQRCHDKSDK